MLCFSGARTLVSLWYQGIEEVGFLRECTCVHIFQYLNTIYTYKIRILKWFTREISIIWFHFSYTMWGGHPLSRSPFHAFNVVLVSCGHFRSHFGQNVISSLSMPMVSNRPYGFLVIVFTPEVIGRHRFWRGARKTIISFSFGHIIKQWTDW